MASVWGARAGTEGMFGSGTCEEGVLEIGVFSGLVAAASDNVANVVGVSRVEKSLSACIEVEVDVRYKAICLTGSGSSKIPVVQDQTPKSGIKGWRRTA